MEYSQIQMEEHFSKYILKCRPGDWEHARRVVNWVKELGKGRADLLLIIIAGYIHDIGWSGLIKDGEKLTRDELLKLQSQADKQTEYLAQEALEIFNLTNDDISKILRLIHATENYIAHLDDEEIIVDADNLSKTDPDHVREKYKKEEWINICSLFEEKLPDRIKTKIGKEIFRVKLAELRLALETDLKQ